MTITTRESAANRRARFERLLADAAPLWTRQRITLRFPGLTAEGDFLHEMEADTIGGLAVHPTVSVPFVPGKGWRAEESLFYWSVSHIGSGRALAEYVDAYGAVDVERLARLIVLRTLSLCDWTMPLEGLQMRSDWKRISRQVRAWARDPFGPDHRWVVEIRR